MRKSFIILFVFILFVQGCNLFVGIGGEDSKPPYIEIISPKNGEVFEGIVDIVFIRGIAFDNEKLSKVLIKIGNKEWVEIGNQENWSYEWDISGIDSGAYSITVKALDFVGNESSVSITVKIDKTLPLISIISPTNNSYVKGTISIDFTATDDYQINGIYLSTNGGSDFDITIFEGGVKNFSSSFSLDTTRLMEGDNILVFKVIDNTGKSKNYSLVLRVDNRIPQITLSSHQQIGGYLVFPEDTTIYGTIDDVYPPKEVMIVMNTNTNYANLTGYSWKYDISFSLSSPSTNEIEVICVDQLDVTNSTNFSVIIDKMPPMSFITFPSAGSITNATIITIQGYSVDDVEVNKIFLSLNGGTNFSQIEYTNHLGTNYFWTNVNLNLLPEGDVVLVVKSYDFASKSLNSQGVLFTLDKTPPVVYITSPTNNTTLSTQFLITAYSEDNNNPVRSMIIKIDDIPVITNNGSYISYLYVTNLQGEGKRNIEVISIDRAGNYSSSVISVVVNTDPPKVSNFVVNSDGSGVFVRGIVYVSGTAYDTTQVSNVGYAVGSLSNIVWIVENAGTSTTNFSFSFDSRDITDGMIDLYIRPTDNLGGFVDFITNLYVDNTPPQ